MSNRTLLIILIAVLFLSVSVWAALTTTTHSTVSRLGEGTLHHEDTSTANSQVILTTPSQSYARRLRSIQAVCSASVSITVSSKITRTITSGSVDILLPDITITASTSGAQYVDIWLIPTDTVVVTIPAGGVGITCSPMVIEERK